MQLLIFVLLVLVIFASTFSFMVYRYEVRKRARDTRRNHYYGVLQSHLSSTLKKHAAS